MVREQHEADGIIEGWVGWGLMLETMTTQQQTRFRRTWRTLHEEEPRVERYSAHPRTASARAHTTSATEHH